jgi:hypothetical protein
MEPWEKVQAAVERYHFVDLNNGVDKPACGAKGEARPFHISYTEVKCVKCFWVVVKGDEPYLPEIQDMAKRELRRLGHDV